MKKRRTIERCVRLGVAIACVSAATVLRAGDRAEVSVAGSERADTASFRDIYPDTWVATDAVGRTMPTEEEVGLPKNDQRRVVGIFYITWHFYKTFGESFLCSDGLPISLSNKYLGDETMRKETANRDPRLKQLILTNDFPTNVTDDLKDSTFVVNEDEFITQHCFTGYRPIKGFNPIYSQALYMKSSFDGIAYRYAETLLINAEAKAELNTITNADLDRTVNQLRDRVGMPHLTVNVGFTDPKWPDWGYSLSPVLQEIRRERCIELAGEGFRFNDLKRWKAGKVLNNVLTYVGKRKPDGNLAIVYPNYTNPDLSYQAGKSRTWEDKMYLYPIPTGELQRNPQLLPQNPGW